MLALSKARLQLREFAIFGPEIVPPLADAVRFIDREAGNLQARGQLQKTRREQPLRCDENKMMTAASDRNLTLDLTNLGRGHATMQRRRGIAACAERIDLILHQRDKRRDNDVGASSDCRRHLVA